MRSPIELVDVLISTTAHRRPANSIQPRGPNVVLLFLSRSTWFHRRTITTSPLHPHCVIVTFFFAWRDPAASITNKWLDQGHASVHGEPKFIERQQPCHFLEGIFVNRVNASFVMYTCWMPKGQTAVAPFDSCNFCVCVSNRSMWIGFSWVLSLW